MPTFKFRCPACDHDDGVERPRPPRHCPECGSPVRDVREVSAEPVKAAPPEEPPELKDLERVARDHAEGHACKYGCVPPTTSKCERCSEEKCSERVARYKHHWKRRKVVKIIKSLVGKDVIDVVTDKDVWKDLAKSRAKKVLDALGVEGEEYDEMLGDLEDAIDKGHEKLRRKLK